MMNDKFRAAFEEEAQELMDKLENLLLELEDDSDNPEMLEACFRVMHTIKGSAGMFGFTDIENFTHTLETVFDELREGRIAFQTQIIDLALRARDQIYIMLDVDDTPDPAEVADITNGLKSLIGEGGGEAESKPAEIVEKKEENTAGSFYRITIKPALDIMMNGTNPLHMLFDLLELGDGEIVATIPGLPDFNDYNPESCYVVWQVILYTTSTKNDIDDVFIFVADECEITTELLSESADLDVKDSLNSLWIGLKENPVIETSDLTAKLVKLAVVEAPVVEAAKPEAVAKPAKVEKKPAKAAKKKRSNKGNNIDANIKVSSIKLDELVNQVGELVTLQARLEQVTQSRNDIELSAISEAVGRLTNMLRDSALHLRMLPIGTLFTKFNRLARDLASELGKEIKLITSGEDTELDKTVIDRLNDPLVHMIRNCADHGIEMPDERVASGKDPVGTILMSAEHSGGNVLIHIKDDGKGIDADKIRAKAIEKGVIPPDSTISDKEVLMCIFASGFSTAQQVTKVSGRGVGMDVVRRTIENLRGQIELDSELGKGTTVTLKLPLTLAIIDGLLVSIADGFYVIPLSNVQECIEMKREELESDTRLINIRGKLIPFISLRDFFNLEGESPEINQVVITQLGDQTVGFAVDEVFGQRQTVIKSLGKLYSDNEGLSGATILGSGDIALILDLFQLMKSIEKLDQVAA